MPENNAILMDNWFPGTDKITVRRGSADHATGMAGDTESLISYTSAAGAGKLFAANGTAIYDVTSAGAVGAAVVSGLTNARFQYVQIGTAGGNFILIMNGADTPRTYDGTSWANTTITGPTVANLIWCNLHQRRLWFGEKDKLSAWYLAVNSIGGAATEFPLAAVARLGGYLVGMWTWTRDAGDGQDDVAAFVTSEGEIIVYAGTDPASASTWSLIGVFRAGKPIGRRCAVKYGGDLMLLTQDGVLFLRTIMGLATDRAKYEAITSQISPAFNADVVAGGSLFGWEAFLYPLGTMLIVNAPQADGKYYQYVINTLTNAPCRFKNLEAKCWGLLDGALYFGAAGGKVKKADTGASDDGAAIDADVITAFSKLGGIGKKAFKLIEPIIEANGDPVPTVEINTDYQVRAQTGAQVASQSDIGLWGIGTWGVSKWGAASQIFRGWRGASGIGRTASIRVRVSSASIRASLVAWRCSYIMADGL
jgi:hypothetical protein